MRSGKRRRGRNPAGTHVERADLNLPGLGGLESAAAGAHGSENSHPVFSQHAEAICATKALEAGHKAVSKNALPEEFLEAVDAVLGGGIAVEKASSAKWRYATRPRMPIRPLTERDIEILLAAETAVRCRETGHRLQTVANTLSRIKEKRGGTNRTGPSHRPRAYGSF
jgi:DNA-binding NarL/FixJ family response regulator